MDVNTVLAFAGCKGAAPEALINDAKRAIECIRECASERVTYKIFDFDKDAMQLFGTSFKLSGNDIKKHLCRSSRVLLMAATLGSEVDGAIRAAQKSDIAFAALLDCAASCAIEDLCDTFCAKMSCEHTLTERFSPGYGDMAIECQKDFCALLDTPRKIGLCVTDAYIMVPTKSVTAVVGVD